MKLKKIVKKVDSQVRVQKRDLQDLIRDEIYGAANTSMADYILIPTPEVKMIAKRIAKRCIIGH